MKSFRKSFTWTSGRKRGLSFATLFICGIILLAVSLQISCSSSGDDSGDSAGSSTLEGGRMLTMAIQILAKQGRI